MDMDHGLTIEQLSEQTGVTVRTIRYYIGQGLLPRPKGRGKAATYNAEHLERLRLIRRLVEQRVPLAEIRDRLEVMTLDEVRTLRREDERYVEQVSADGEEISSTAYVSRLLSRARTARRQARPAPDAKFFSEEFSIPPGIKASMAPPSGLPRPKRESDTWRRIELAPGVELNIRTDAEEQHWQLIERLLRTVDDEDT